MDEQTGRAMAQRMRARRERIFSEVADAEDDLRWIAEDRESELEERAQEEHAARLLARLDDRGKREIEEIDEALRRISSGSYGICEGCAEPIPIARLEVLPTTHLCVACAQSEEGEARRYAPRLAEQRPVRPSERVSGELSNLSDPELETWLRELVRDDGRVDMQELRIVCRHGAVHLDGAVPSEPEHVILLGLIEDVAGLHEVDDRLEIAELPWEREDRAAGTRPLDVRPAGTEPATPTEDVVESVEGGVDQTPPDGPNPDEE